MDKTERERMLARRRQARRRERLRAEGVNVTVTLTHDEAAQLEIVKHQVGKQTGSEAIKYVIREYPRFCAHYKQQAKEWKEKEKLTASQNEKTK